MLESLGSGLHVCKIWEESDRWTLSYRRLKKVYEITVYFHGTDLEQWNRSGGSFLKTVFIKIFKICFYFYLFYLFHLFYLYFCCSLYVIPCYLLYFYGTDGWNRLEQMIWLTYPPMADFYITLVYVSPRRGETSYRGDVEAPAQTTPLQYHRRHLNLNGLVMVIICLMKSDIEVG